jgi:hypothetical protein
LPESRVFCLNRVSDAAVVHVKWLDDFGLMSQYLIVVFFFFETTKKLSIAVLQRRRQLVIFPFSD